MISLIVFQTNLYATQKGERYILTTEKEIRTFIGINFIMGINKLPSYRDYWSTVPYLRNEYICRLMTVNRFGWLLSHIHLNDNSIIPARNSPNFDKLYKLRPFLDKIEINFQKNFNLGPSIAIDESMIKFKGRSNIKQYLPKKPIKRGYKVWMLADKSGYCYRFQIYTGKTDKQVTKDLGGKVVNTLTSDLDGKEHRVYFDNYFTSVKLMENLLSRKINACGIIKKNRKHLPEFRKTMKTRGELETFVSDTGIIASKWIDSTDVYILSNFHSNDPNKITTVLRKNNKGVKIAVPAPPSIADYNKNMNSVDKFDQLMSSYNIDRRSKKWWHRIFFYFLDAAVLNAYISYKHFIDIELKNFKGKCAEGFVTETLLDKIPPSETTLRSIPIRIKNSKPTVSLEIRKTSSKHQPIRVHGTRRRCALCSTKKKEFRTSWRCSVCEVPLCLGKKNCFNKYHL